MAGGGAITGIKVNQANGVQPTKFQTNFAFGLITSLFFLWGFSYGLLDVLNKHFQVSPPSRARAPRHVACRH